MTTWKTLRLSDKLDSDIQDNFGRVLETNDGQLLQGYVGQTEEPFNTWKRNRLTIITSSNIEDNTGRVIQNNQGQNIQSNTGQTSSANT